MGSKTLLDRENPSKARRMEVPPKRRWGVAATVRSDGFVPRTFPTVRWTIGERPGRGAVRPVQEKVGGGGGTSSSPAPLCGGRSLAHNPGRNTHKPSEEFPQQIGGSKFARNASTMHECVEDVSFLDECSKKELCSKPNLAHAKRFPDPIRGERNHGHVPCKTTHATMNRKRFGLCPSPSQITKLASTIHNTTVAQPKGTAATKQDTRELSCAA